MTRSADFLDRAQREPVRVLEHGQGVGMKVTAAEDEAMRACYADRLARTLDDTAATAARASLTPEALERLLADES